MKYKVGDEVIATDALVAETLNTYGQTYKVTSGKSYTVIGVYSPIAIYIKDDNNNKYGVLTKHVDTVKYKHYTRRLP